MSLFGKILSGGIVEGVSKITQTISDMKAKKIDGAVALSEIEIALPKLQAEITKVEAAHASIFVAGWRPAIGWVCAISLFVYYVPRFLMATVLWTAEIWTKGQWIAPPEVGISDVLGLVGTLLGMSYLRTREKESGVNEKH